MTSYDSARRACVVLYRLALMQDSGGLALAVRAIHDPLPGTPLGADVPHRERLAAAGYTAVEDLAGADVEELVVCVGLTAREAATVLVARSLLSQARGKRGRVRVLPRHKSTAFAGRMLASPVSLLEEVLKLPPGRSTWERAEWRRVSMEDEVRFPVSTAAHIPPLKVNEDNTVRARVPAYERAVGYAALAVLKTNAEKSLRQRRSTVVEGSPLHDGDSLKVER